MTKNNRHNAAFVVGSVVGAVAGAAVALWKTPYTGEELRSKLTGPVSNEGVETRAYAAPQGTGTVGGEQRSIKDKVLSGVEKTLAPIVGVELGRTANGSSATPMDSGDIKVSPEHGASTLRGQRSWTGGGEAAAATGADTEKIGLSVDRVDAEKWAAAYGTSADTPAATPSEPVRTETASPEHGTSRLRQTRSWTDGSEAETTSAADTRIGMSVDRVDAEKWAAAYGTEVPASSTQETQVSSGTNSSSTSAGGQYGSKAAESEAQTGLGSKPAYPDNDQTGHEPVDRTAPDSSVADVDRRADNIRTDSGLTVEDAAPVDALTRPQVDRTPDSMRTPDEGSYHPFPKLGGKD